MKVSMLVDEIVGKTAVVYKPHSDRIEGIARIVYVCPGTYSQFADGSYEPFCRVVFLNKPDDGFFYRWVNTNNIVKGETK